MSFLLPLQIEVKERPSTYSAPSPLQGVGAPRAGEGVAVRAHPDLGSFMLNRQGSHSFQHQANRTGWEGPPGPFLAPS